MVFVIHWLESALDIHVFPIPIPPPTSLSTRSLWACQMPVRYIVRKRSFSRSERLKLFIVFCNQRWQEPGMVCIPLIITWIWANLGRRWRTGKPGVLQSMGSQKVGHDLETDQQRSLYGFLWYHLARSHREGQGGDLWYLLNKEVYL